MNDDKKDEILVRKLKESLDNLDCSMNVNTPDMGHFRKLVSDIEERKQAKRKKETIVFAVSAIILLFMEMYAFNMSTAIFIAVQVISSVSLVAGVLSIVRQRRRQVNAR